MEKEQILKLIELKCELIKAEEKHEKELTEARNNGSYAYAEGYVSPVMDEIESLQKEIDIIR